MFRVILLKRASELKALFLPDVFASCMSVVCVCLCVRVQVISQYVPAKDPMPFFVDGQLDYRGRQGQIFLSLLSDARKDGKVCLHALQ
jgi:hypothetical protein